MASNPDFRTLFASAPGLYLVLRPDLTIAAASDPYLHATMTERTTIIGRHLFEVFPDNPDDPTATGVHNLGASLERVLIDRVSDRMPLQRYDIRLAAPAGGGFEERYWSAANVPILGLGQQLTYIIHRVEDVTTFVKRATTATERDVRRAIDARAAPAPLRARR